MKRAGLALAVEQQPGGARIAVARLADRARVEQLGAAVERHFLAGSALPPSSAGFAERRARAPRGCGRRARGRVVCARSEASATSAVSTYSQIGSRIEPWKSATPDRSPDGASSASTRARPGVSTLRVQRAATAASDGELVDVEHARARRGRGCRRGRSRRARARSPGTRSGGRRSRRCRPGTRLVEALRVRRRSSTASSAAGSVDVGDDGDAHASSAGRRAAVVGSSSVAVVLRQVLMPSRVDHFE